MICRLETANGERGLFCLRHLASFVGPHTDIEDASMEGLYSGPLTTETDLISLEVAFGQ